MARKCNVGEIERDEAKRFLDRNHIQGFANSSVYLGCHYNGKLNGVMSFRKASEGTWELNRFATDYDYICNGVGGKLFTCFKNHYAYAEVKSFADRRWTITDENLYTNLGFRLESVLPPDYRYVKGNKRVHKFNYRKNRINKMYGLPLTMSESEMMNSLGIYRIWDCGLYKYVYRKEGNET